MSHLIKFYAVCKFSYLKRVKVIRKPKKWYPPHNSVTLYPYYVITNVTWGISFDVLSVSLDYCMTVLLHPINKNYSKSMFMSTILPEENYNSLLPQKAFPNWAWCRVG